MLNTPRAVPLTIQREGIVTQSRAKEEEKSELGWRRGDRGKIKQKQPKIFFGRPYSRADGNQQIQASGLPQIFVPGESKFIMRMIIADSGLIMLLLSSNTYR